ncbi:hypothetical protein CXB51_015928 [Gossypium anomalum]|uniref:Uncharacterized protein n=1 Tax=Gossypium anomalum TaxID=47600 RepID=A0A8J5Z7J1_9ROSI|nr:hypothetical protein CXB51_015928 [Gossypium anomalum]
MASASFSSTQPLIPIVNGEKYEWWSIKVKTLPRSQELWDLVGYGFADILEPDEEEKRLKEIKKNDAKALFIIQQAVYDSIFSRIAAATTSNEMKNGESIAELLSRTIVGHLSFYGKQISDEIIVAKVLRSSTTKFDHVVAAIEEFKDLSVLFVDQLMGSLQSHKARINRLVEKSEEQAFQVKETFTNQGDNDRSTNNYRGRGGFRGGRGRGYDRDRGRNDGQRQYNKQQKVTEENKLFMACIDVNHKPNDLWFLDSGCLNHMTSTKSLFKVLDESQRINVQLGNKREMQVEGKGTLGKQVHVHMTPNKMFPLDVSNMENFVLVASAKDDSKLWHLRYGRLNIKGLKLLSDKGMVLDYQKLALLIYVRGAFME